MLNIVGHVENYNMCRKLCWNSMLKISACVENCNACRKLCQNFKVLKMFMLGVLKTISKTMLKYEKNTITLYGMCWNWAADFVFLLRFCTRKRSETYVMCFCFCLVIIYIYWHFSTIGLSKTTFEIWWKFRNWKYFVTVYKQPTKHTNTVEDKCSTV